MLSARDDVTDLIDSELNQTWRTRLLQRMNAPSGFMLFIHRLTPSLLIKHMEDGEELNTEFVHQNTTISVPRIHRDSSGNLAMDFIEADMLYECWHKLSAFMQFRVACTARLYIKQMRAIRRPTVGALHNGHVRGGFLFDNGDYGTFEDAQHFRRFCEYMVFVTWQSQVFRAVHEDKAPDPLPCPNIDWTPVFIHADLNSSNLMLDKRGSLWIVDWATAGFYPQSLEAYSMCLVDDTRGTSWYGRYFQFICGGLSAEERRFWSFFQTNLAAFRRSQERPSTTADFARLRQILGRD